MAKKIIHDVTEIEIDDVVIGKAKTSYEGLVGTVKTIKNDETLDIDVNGTIKENVPIQAVLKQGS